MTVRPGERRRRSPTSRTLDCSIGERRTAGDARLDELQALQELLAAHPRFIVATGGSLVSETATYELLLRTCFTVWVRTTPEEHMQRVLAQGDLRPMAGSQQAMDDLRRILEELSLQLATPTEARPMLGLKGPDKVGF